MQEGLLNARTQGDIAALLGDDDDRRNMLRRHDAYLGFVTNWYGESQLLPWWQRVVEIRGTRLHVAGLDTAWMSCGDEDRSRLLLGRCQLTQTVERPAGRKRRLAYRPAAPPPGIFGRIRSPTIPLSRPPAL